MIAVKLRTFWKELWKFVFAKFKRFVETLMPIMGMPVKPFYGKQDFPWLQILEDNYEKIREEMLALYHHDLILKVKDVNKNVSDYVTDNNWKTFMFCMYGHRIEKNFALCPFTESILKQVPAYHTAFFSVLEAGKSIPEHRGVYRGNTLAHLGLVVPVPVSQCVFEVNGEVRNWEEGKAFVFEDSYMHAASNHADSFRAVLIIEFKRSIPFLLRPFDNFIQRTLKNSYITQNIVKIVNSQA